MKNKVIKKLLLILVNSITIIRLLGAFILPFIYYKNGSSVTAVTIIILFFTDAIDGFLARKFKISTLFGSAMDALADKILNFISFIILGIEFNIMFCPFILELTILLINYLIYRHGGNVQSSKIGKIKTIVLDIMVIFCFILLSLPLFNNNYNIINFLINNISIIIYIIALIIIIFELITIFDYDRKYIITKNDPKIKHIKLQNRKKKTLMEFLTDLLDTDYYLKHKNESIIKQFYK